MRAALIVCGVLATGCGTLSGADAPAVDLDELNRAPEKFEGKTVLVRADVCGAVVEGPVWHRLTVRGVDGGVLPNKLRPDGITFVVARSDADRLTKGWGEDRFVPVRLTARVFKGERGNWHAAVSAVEKGERPTAARLNERPQEFVGQTLVLDRVEVAGDAVRVPGRYGLAVKADKLDFKPVPEDGQRVRFATPGQGEAVRAALRAFKPGGTHLARLTVRVEKLDRADYVATVKRIDLLRFEDEGEAAGDAIVATAEEVAADHKAFAGKWVAFDRVRLTKDTAAGPARMQIGVKTPAGTEFKPPAAESGKGFRFSLPDKGARAKTYLETRWGEDVDQPVRLVCKLGEQAGVVAVVRRIDRVVDFPAEEKAGEK